MAVDVTTRKFLADQLSALIHGEITNQEFDQGFDGEACWTLSEDDGVKEVATAAWFLYDDFKTTRFVGKQSLSATTLDDFDRAVCFLKTELEYVWPNFPGKPLPACLVAGDAVLSLIGAAIIYRGLQHDPIVRELLMLAGAVLTFPFCYWAHTSKIKRGKYRNWLANGDFAVWPFLTRADYEKASVALNGG